MNMIVLHDTETRLSTVWCLWLLLLVKNTRMECNLASRINNLMMKLVLFYSTIHTLAAGCPYNIMSSVSLCSSSDHRPSHLWWTLQKYKIKYYHHLKRYIHLSFLFNVYKNILNLNTKKSILNYIPHCFLNKLLLENNEQTKITS